MSTITFRDRLTQFLRSLYVLLAAAHSTFGRFLTGALSNSNDRALMKAPPLHPIVMPLSGVPEKTGELQNVGNFRDVGSNFNADAATLPNPPPFLLKTETLFRSARLDDATVNDIATLRSTHNVKTVIDLRSDLERKDSFQVSATFLSSAVEEAIPHTMSPVPRHAEPTEEQGYFAADTGVDGGDDVTSSSIRHRFSIEFAGEEFRNEAVWRPLSMWQKCKVVALMAAQQKPAAVYLIGQEFISPQGLIGLYRNFADFCGSEIVRALKLLAIPSHFPVLVHCTQGKDRTGLVIAMALHCAGAPRELILRDFERSQEGLDAVRDIMVAEMEKTGLDSTFSDAPRDVLDDTFDYIIRKHGTVDKYLDRAGFGAAWREKLRKNLVEDSGTS
ncbi:hypothetical protein HKX48_000893 [Thoreauomyces humboldtii]|nr:hypothetical protein HKX48_000893 [Thoreauomyces humboldtii]